jgi:hypothetical protein
MKPRFMTGRELADRAPLIMRIAAGRRRDDSWEETVRRSRLNEPTTAEVPLTDDDVRRSWREWARHQTSRGLNEMFAIVCDEMCARRDDLKAGAK